MSKAVTTIAYSGSLVDEGIMDVKSLAPALLSLGELIEETNKALNGSDSKMQVRIRGFRKGSFEVNLEAVATLAQQVKMAFGAVDGYSAEEILEVLTGPYMTAAANGLEVSGGAGYGLFKLIKWLRNRPIRKASELENGNTLLEVESDGEDKIVEVKKEVLVAFRNIKIREIVSLVLQPLNENGVEAFEFRREKEVIEQITKEEVSYFEFNEEEINSEKEEVLETEFDAVYRMITASFDEGYKWRLSDSDNNTITARLLDEDFSKKIDNNEIGFYKGDRLQIKVRRKQTISAAGKEKIEYFVLKVIKFVRRPEQIQLPFEEN